MTVSISETAGQTPAPKDYADLQWMGVTLGMAAYILASIRFGADCNFDLRNYHYYNGYAFLYGPNDHNLFPAQVQSWINPQLDSWIVWLMRHLKPLWVGLILAAVQSLNIPCLFLISRYTLRPVLSDMSPALRAWTTLAVVFIGATGAMGISEIGTTFGDNIACVPVLAGLACLMRALSGAPSRTPCRWIALAGFALGIASGLKLTALIFMPGFVMGLFWTTRKPSSLFATAALFGAAVFAGWGILDGAWAWNLWIETGNPVFPQLNHLFPSPWIGPVDTTDNRFSARTVTSFFAYPFLTAIGDHPGSEAFLADARYALCFLLLPIALFRRPRGAALAFLVVFFTSLTIWMILFGIQRYALPLEMTGGVVMALIVGRALSPAPRAVTLTALAVLLAITTTPPEWGRAPWAIIGKDGNWFNVHVPAELEAPNQMFLMLDDSDKPQSYIIPFFRTDSSFVRMLGSLKVRQGTYLYQKRFDAIATHNGPMYSLSNDPPQRDQQLLLGGYGLHFSTPHCTVMRTLVDALYFCPLERN